MNDNRRQFLRGVLNDAYKGLTGALVPAGAALPTTYPYVVVDVGRSRRVGLDQSAGDDPIGIVGGSVDEVSTAFVVRYYVSADRPDNVDVLIDEALESIDLVTRTFVDGFRRDGLPTADGDRYSISVQSIHLIEEIPSPSTSTPKGVAVVSGEIVYFQIWNIV